MQFFGSFIVLYWTFLNVQCGYIDSWADTDTNFLATITTADLSITIPYYCMIAALHEEENIIYTITSGDENIPPQYINFTASKHESLSTLKFGLNVINSKDELYNCNANNAFFIDDKLYFINYDNQIHYLHVSILTLCIVRFDNRIHRIQSLSCMLHIIVNTSRSRIRLILNINIQLYLTQQM